MNDTTLYRIEGFADLWVDACLRDDEGELMFLSFYGRDASAMQFVAAVELGSRAEAGITSFNIVNGAGRRHQVGVGPTERLAKHSGRLPRQNLFGPLSQIWIYDKRMREVDKANRIGWIVNLVDEPIEASAWQLLKELSPVALLDTWQRPLMAWARDKGAMAALGTGLYAPIGRAAAVRVSVTDHFVRHVSACVRSGVLTA